MPQRPGNPAEGLTPEGQPEACGEQQRVWGEPQMNLLTDFLAVGPAGCSA